jgi:hypothetical protein
MQLSTIIDSLTLGEPNDATVGIPNRSLLIFTFTPTIKNVSKLRTFSVHCFLVVTPRRLIKINDSDFSVANEKVVLANVAMEDASTMYRLQCCKGCFSFSMQCRQE